MVEQQDQDSISLSAGRSCCILLANEEGGAKVQRREGIEREGEEREAEGKAFICSVKRIGQTNVGKVFRHKFEEEI